MLKVKYGTTIEIVVRRATVRTDLNRQTMLRQLLENTPDDVRGQWSVFAELCSVTQRAKGLSFDPATLAQADKDTLDAAYNCFLDIDVELRNRWYDAVQQVNGPIDDITGPEPLPDNADPNA